MEREIGMRQSDTAAEGGGRCRPQGSLNETIHQELRWNLVSGIYLPGKRLSTRMLAKEFGTSAMPVREALRQLVAERILVVEQKSAFRVPFISRDRGLKLFEIRKTLEMLATRHAVPHLSRVHVDLLKKFNNDLMSALERGDRQGYFSANYSFHFLIYSAADSPDLVALIERSWMQIGPFYASILDINTYNQIWQAYHVAIIDAIRVGDAEAAAAAVAQDIDSAKDYFISSDAALDYWALNS